MKEEAPTGANPAGAKSGPVFPKGTKTMRNLQSKKRNCNYQFGESASYVK